MVDYSFGRDLRLERLGSRAAGFNPNALFSGAEQGGWYDPSLIWSLSQDTAGAVPVAAFGDPIGRMLDQSGRGTHAVQATAGLRPLYARMPAGGRRNLLMATDNLAAWALQQTPDVTADGTLGGEPAFMLTDNDAAAWEAVLYTIPTNLRAEGAHSFSVRVKKNAGATSGASCRVNVFDGVTTQNAGFTINPVSGANVTGSAWAYGGRVTTITDQGDYWGVSIAFTISVGHYITSTSIFPAHYNLNGSSSANTNTGSNTFAAPQLERNAVTAYQRVTSISDITETGRSSKFAALDDLVDDALTVTLPAGMYTVAYGEDAGVTILTGQVLVGSYTLPGPARLYGAVILNRALTGAETTQVTAWLAARSP